MKNLFLIILLSTFIISCGNKDKTELTTSEQLLEHEIVLSEAQYKNAEIASAKLAKKDISSLLKANGKIDVSPQSMISISVPMGGYVKNTKLLPGMLVKKGETLALIEDAQYVQIQQDYLTAKAQFLVIENEFIRQKELNQSKATSDKVFEQTKANYETQLVLIKALEEKLKLIGLNPQNLNAQNISNSIAIFSPIEGFVSSVNINVGKYVNPSDVLFELINPNDIYLSLSVFEKDIHQLAVGQTIFAFSNMQPDKKYVGQIYLIAPNLSNQGASEVLVRFEKYDKTLLPGMFMNAEIELAGNNVNALPEAAIVRYEGKQYVFIENNNYHYQMQEVEVGSTENGFTEVILPENVQQKTFVINGAYNLLMAIKNQGDEDE